MFDTTNFDLINTLIDKCHVLVKDHNKLSYTQLQLKPASVSYSYISKEIPKDSVALDIVAFYEIFTYQSIAIGKISMAISKMEYSYNDLMINLNRSDDSIIKTLSELTGIRQQLIDYTESISTILTKQTDIFIEYMRTQFPKNIQSVIDVVCICMLQKNLETSVDIDTVDKFFIPIGVRLIEGFSSQIFNDGLVEYVRQKINYVKQNILMVKQLGKSTNAINRFQTFNIFPDEGRNVNIQTAMRVLFNTSIEVDSLIKGIQPIETMLKQISPNQMIGIIIITTISDDSYFDLSKLSDIQQSSNAAGVTHKLIQDTALLQTGDKATIKKMDMIPINVTNDTESAYILWTNDMKSFKLRKNPISNMILRNILRRAPSSLICAYNNLLSSIISQLRPKDDVIKFKRMQYLTFSNTVSEEAFINIVKSNLKTVIEDMQNGDDRNYASSVQFYKKILNTLDKLKDELGIPRVLLSAHCHLIYNQMASKIYLSIKKKLMVSGNRKLSPQELSVILNEAMDGNDNIYSRTVASYYMYVA